MLHDDFLNIFWKDIRGAVKHDDRHAPFPLARQPRLHLIRKPPAPERRDLVRPVS
jgi:hypothetical protein